MSTRFDSRKNNPHSQVLTSKKKVLREFRRMQEALNSVNLEPNDGGDYFEQEPVTTEKEHRTEEIGTGTERSSKVLNRMWDDEKFFTRQETDHVKGHSRRFHSLDAGSADVMAQKKGKGAHQHRLDPLNFCTMSTYHQTMIQPRSKGFIDFNLQQRRPAFATHKAHEHRFQYLNHFPSPHSGARHVAQLDFNKQVSRKDYNKVQMSESCFDHQKVDYIRKKAQGLLHFANSTEKKLPGPKRMPIESGGDVGDATLPRSPELYFEKQIPRVQNISLNNKLVTREDKRAMYKLPAHMHNVHNRMGCSNLLERGLRETKQNQADWLEPKTTLDAKKSFRHDISGSPPPAFDPQKPPKKKLTFTQLLVKFGYITADKTKENRKRPWHITPINLHGYSSSSDDEGGAPI